MNFGDLSMAQANLGSRIREERLRVGILQEELASQIGVERTALNRIEAGGRKVTALELASIARALNVRMSSFFESPVPAVVSHRSSQGLDTEDSSIDQELARIADTVDFLARMGASELALEKAIAVGNSHLAVPSTNAQAERLAGRARKLMELPPGGPILDLTAAVASLGLLAFSVNIGPDTADAGIVALEPGAVALINSYMKVGRRRLALAHELGHHILSDGYAVDWRVDAHSEDLPHESRIDRFARSLLLPERSMRQGWVALIATLGPRKAAVKLASEYKVDMATLSRRLLELRIVDTAMAGDIREVRTTRADIVELDLVVPLSELEGTSVPKPYTLAILGLVQSERISRERALELLRGTFDEIDLPTPRMRHESDIWAYVS